MPISAKGSHREVVDNNQVHETSDGESSSSEQEVFLNSQPSYKCSRDVKCVYALYRGVLWMMGCIIDFFSGS